MRGEETALHVGVDAVGEELDDVVDAALRKVLTDIDPFWVRWSAFAEPFLEPVP